MNNKRKKACAYCGRETASTTEKCQNCGSSTFETLEDAVLHQEQYRQFNEQHPPKTSTVITSEEHEHNNRKTKSIAIAVVVAVLIGLISFIRSSGIIFSCGDNKYNVIHSYSIGETIQTNNLNLIVYEGKIVRSRDVYGGLNAPDIGYERIMVEVEFQNKSTYNDLNVNIYSDCYINATNSSGSPHLPLNAEGSYTIYDRLDTDGMFFDRFILSANQSIRGYIAFDIPRETKLASFVYLDFGNNDSSYFFQHWVDLEYEKPIFLSDKTLEFYTLAYNSGYVIEVINDYDGFKTFWVGAFKYPSEREDKAITQRPEPIYWIDCTRDNDEDNARIEFNNYVKKVKKIGGEADSYTTGNSYRYQSNTSSTKFGIAYQIGVFNYLVESAPIEYKQEILEFFNLLDLSMNKS